MKLKMGQLVRLNNRSRFHGSYARIVETFNLEVHVEVNLYVGNNTFRHKRSLLVYNDEFDVVSKVEEVELKLDGGIQ
jgi:hypothetical protein